jgi:hypothetical protein
VKHGGHILLELAVAMVLFSPGALAQKPTAPTPAPAPSPAPSIPSTPAPVSPQPSQRDADLVMFLRGRVATGDGTPVPHDVLVERLCNGRVNQQVYASPRGDFSMQMGSMNDSFLDATGDRSSLYGVNSKDSLTGIPRRELTSCEMRASVSGFRSDIVMLAGLTGFGGTIDVGSIVVQRTGKVDGLTLSAAPYKAPQNALKAYEKGLAAEKSGKLANAREYFEKAVEIYPRYTYAWFRLGAVLEAQNQKDAARTAYTRATNIDTQYLPPYLALAVMEYEARHWAEVVNLTGHILELDPLNHESVTGYIVDFDPLNCAEAYLYNALANYRLDKIEDAEKNALKAEQRADLSRFPQLRLLLAEIYAQKKNYGSAIAEMQAYLQLFPHAKNADRVREELAKLEKLNGSAPTGENPDQK